MNNQSPLVPQGSMLEQKNRSRARVRLAVFCVLSIHVVGLMALLMQGCRRQEVTDNQPTVDTNTTYAAMPTLETNPAPPYSAPAPITNSAPIVTQNQNPQTYTVAAGDMLSTIAKKFPGVTWKGILDANPGLEPTKLQVGKVIHIPPPATPAPTMTASATLSTPSATTEGAQLYTVQSGDNLTKIAGRFNTSVRALRSANSLASDILKVGQKLKIPSHPAASPMASPVTTASAHPAA